MADLSLRYLLYGEDKTASKAIKGVGTQASSTGSLVAGGLSKMGTMVGGEVGAMIDRVSAGFDQMGGKAKGMGAKMTLAGTGMMGLGMAATAMASKDVESQKQLQAAVEATGKGYEGFGRDVDKLIQKQVQFGHTDGEVTEALRVLTQAYGDPKKALEKMSLATDLAAAKHIDLATAAGMVGKAHGGAGRIFKEFGIAVDKNKKGTSDYEGALDKMSGKLKGQASASMDSFGGKVKQVKTWLDNQASSIGEKYGPALTMAGTVVTALGTVTQILAARQAAAALATDAATGATARMTLGSKIATVAQWLWNAALTANPIGIVVMAIAALVGAIILIATKTTWFQTVWQYMTSSLAVAWQWLWNTILAPIIRFVLNGFASITDGIANMLSVLSNIPGFGWAKTASDKMKDAAAKAHGLANSIKDIKSPPPIALHFTSNLGAIGRQIMDTMGAKNKLAGMRASGGPVLAGSAYLVGENGPELFVPGSNGGIIPNGGGGSPVGGGSGGASTPLVVQFVLDGRVLHQSLLQLKRTNGGGLALG